MDVVVVAAAPVVGGVVEGFSMFMFRVVLWMLAIRSSEELGGVFDECVEENEELDDV